MVVIGSSFISMELVVAISKRELASIDVIGLEEFPFQAVLGKEIGASLKKVLTALRFNEQIHDHPFSIMNPRASNSIC